MSNYFVPTQVLPQREFEIKDEVEILESAWWRLEPGQPGYDQPIWAYCGLSHEEWENRKLRRGWR